MGGGSAWAIVHIGVIKVLEENGIRIHSISGTSAGSIVASLYAFGISVEKMQEIALSLRLSDIFNWKVSRMGLSSTQKIKHLIKKYIGDAKVEESLIPLYIPATDIVSLKPVLMQNISVAEAVAASCAIPGIFTPVTINNQMYVDGSLFADVPCKILKLKKMSLVVGVELTDTNKLAKKPANIFEVITKSLQGLINETRKERLRYADVVISPNISSVGRFEFEKAQLLLEIGQKAAKEHIDYIKKRLGIK